MTGGGYPECMSVYRMIMRGVCVGAAAMCVGLSAGCMQFKEVGFDGQLMATNREGTKSFVPTYLTSAYTYRDENSVDMYLSEFPEEWFTGSSVGKNAIQAGSILHVHLFLAPSAGSTPIDVTACNVVFLNLILTGERAPGVTDARGRTGPEMGLYAGGGFLLPDDDPGDASFGGAIDRASHRLSRATPGFVDVLGTGYLAGAIRAPLDETLAKSMQARLDELVAMLPPVVIPKDGSRVAPEEGEE